MKLDSISTKVNTIVEKIQEDTDKYFARMEKRIVENYPASGIVTGGSTDMQEKINSRHVAKTGKGPSPNHPPQGSSALLGNKQAMKIWNETLEKHNDVIFKDMEPGKQWAVAVAIYRRACAKRNVSAFPLREHLIFWSNMLEELELDVMEIYNQCDCKK